MATQYTSLLGLALPVTGELSGSWGDTVNTAITSLLDNAVAGTTSLTTDADVTLSTTVGIANQARQAIILWNPASGTVTRNITAPAQSKIYTVINASGGTQSIVIRGAGPTTGVTIIKGESAQVAWNGTDFVKISSTAGDVTVRNITVTGSATLNAGTANGVAYLNGSKVLSTDSGFVYNGTALGLGATPNVWPASAVQLLNGSLSSLTGPFGQVNLTSNAYASGNPDISLTTWRYTKGLIGDLGPAGRYSITGAGHRWFTAVGGLAGDPISFTERMVMGDQGLFVVPGSTAFLTGSLGSRLWTPALSIGATPNAGLFGPALTYLAEKSGSSWISSGGGVAGALTIDEGFFSFARSQSVGAPGTALTWTTALESGSNGDFSFNSTGFTKVASGPTAARPFASAGRLRWNTTIGQLEVGDGANFEKVLLDTIATSASGGTITTSGDYRIHTFTSSGTFTLTTVSGGGSIEIQVLVIGGGGAGGFYLGGGGGSGAMLEAFANIPAGTYTVSVGAGGSATTVGTSYSFNGAASSIQGGPLSDRQLFARGGGAGGNGSGDALGANGSADSGGSGGGGASPFALAFSSFTVFATFGGAPGINGSGGAPGTNYNGSTFNGGGGGGGALASGVMPTVGNNPVGNGGNGGSGRTSNITGSNLYYAGGGGGGYGTFLTATSGGQGGGGQGAGSAGTFQATAGAANTGSGGGGGQSATGFQVGGAGGSGIVIIRYKFQ